MPRKLRRTCFIAHVWKQQSSTTGLRAERAPKTRRVLTAPDYPGSRQWYFKPAQAKFSTQAKPYRAYVQEAGYKVQGIVDPDSAVEVGVGDLGGKFGAFQKKVDIQKGAIDLEKWQTGQAVDLGTDITAQLQREHVTDWLLGNFDAHGENFVTDTAGRIVGLDKEQAFRYIKDAKSAKMSYTYHPNSAYGETEPIYNTLYRRFAKGEIDMNLQDTLAYIKRVESIPDAEYREIFRGYAEAYAGKGKAAEDLLDAIVDRKDGLRETYRAFYSELLTERTGTATKFIWADEGPAVMAQPLAAVQQTVASVKGMSVADLKAIAKNKGIAYYNAMNKTQLVTAITDPTKAAEMSTQVKNRLAASAASRKANAAAVSPAASMPKGVEAAADVFTDLSRVPVSRTGIPVASDRGIVEGLELNARRMLIDGKEYYEVSGKLTRSAWEDVVKRTARKGKSVALEFEEADPSMAMFSSRPLNVNVSLQARRVTDGDGVFDVYVDSREKYHSWQGFFRARVPVSASGTVDGAEMSRMLKGLGLDDILQTPTPEAEKTFIKRRLIWQNAPSRTAETRGLTGRALEDKLDDILQDIGITEKRVNGVSLMKVYDGYATYYDPELAQTMKKAGADYVWAGMNRNTSVVRAIKSGGMKSTNRRMLDGIKMTGASPEADMRRGGADSVFTRLGVKSKTGPKYNDCYKGGPYRMLIDSSELGRTDWYAYDSDQFGITDPSVMGRRDTPIDFVKNMVNNYHVGNEIMFRHGIPSSSFIGVRCQTQTDLDNLLQLFAREGITEVNGIPVNQFAKVGNSI